MGQMQVESGGFRSMHEGLNYRPERLLAMFGPRMDGQGVRRNGRNGLTSLDEARRIVANGAPGIAEAIYGGAWGARNLGNIEPGDGWRYHGRGYVQLTGRGNYERIGRALRIDLVNQPDLAADRQIAARVALHYWQDRVRENGHQFDVRAATRDINGGENHLAERASAARAWMRRLRADAPHPEAPPADAHVSRPTQQEAASATARPARHAAGAQAIYIEAYRYFLSGGNRFEYGRGDVRLPNREGNRRTDPSRDGRDLDGDGLRGVDCSAFVWRGLRNAGYDVSSVPFSTHALFDAAGVSSYARQHFDVIPGEVARGNRGNLQAGDVILFKDRQSDGQHLGIFKGYDANGVIQFIGSQVQTGPAQAAAGEGSYWNGGRFEIVGALRAKAEFQVRTPLHAQQAVASEQDRPAVVPVPPRDVTRGHPAASAAPDRSLRHGDKGPGVAQLQRRLFDLGYAGRDGEPLAVDAVFGPDTGHALEAFQRARGLQGVGLAGPGTAAALDRAEGALVSHPCHAHHALYLQLLDKVHEGERARGATPRPHSRRIAAALVVECLREGVSRVDRVEFSHDGSRVRAVQAGALRDEPGLNRVTGALDAAQAMRQPLADSSEQMRTAAVELLARQRDERQQALEARQGRSAALSH